MTNLVQYCNARDGGRGYYLHAVLIHRGVGAFGRGKVHSVRRREGIVRVSSFREVVSLQRHSNQHKSEQVCSIQTHSLPSDEVVSQEVKMRSTEGIGWE